MILLNQQIALAENTEDVLRLVADAWRAGGCPDTAYAIEEHIRGREENAVAVSELEDEYIEEIEELKEKISELQTEIDKNEEDPRD